MNAVELEVQVKSSAPAHFVWLECDVEGHFNSNGITLLPNAPKTIRFVPASKPKNIFDVEKIFKATLTIKTMYDVYTCGKASK